MPDLPATTVVVVTWRGRAHIAACLAGLAAQTRAHRILVVDNASTDGTADILAEHGVPVLRLKTNLGYAGALAAALQITDTESTAWLNDDAVPEPGWLAACEDALTDGVGAVASVLLRVDGTAQSTGVALTPDGHGRDITIDDPTEGDPFGFCGGAALLRTTALREIGGVPAHFFCYYEDTDTAWRLRLAGWDIARAPHARVRHEHGASTDIGSRDFHRWNERNRLLMLLRCAPLSVALRQLARFAALTAVLPLRRLTDPPPNHTARLRLRILAEIAVRTPTALASRRATRIRRATLWQRWATESWATS